MEATYYTKEGGKVRANRISAKAVPVPEGVNGEAVALGNALGVTHKGHGFDVFAIVQCDKADLHDVRVGLAGYGCAGSTLFADGSREADAALSALTWMVRP